MVTVGGDGTGSGRGGGPGWRVVTASALGSMHRRTGLPNQDAVAATSLPGPVPGVVAALADGHGGSRYVRSDVGSRAAVDAAVAAGVRWSDHLGAGRSHAEIVASVRTELVPGLVRQWRETVAADAARRPFTDEELARAGSPLADDPVVAYGATVLLAIAVTDQLVLAQLGDGDITVVSADGRVSAPVPGDDRLVAGQTTSLCLAGAEDDFRVTVVPARDSAQLVLLSSDGYGNSFADAGWQQSVALDLRDHVSHAGLDRVANELPIWLAESAEAGGDDVTVALLARPVPPPDRAVAARPTRHRAGTAATTTAVALAVLAAGFGAGWLARAATGDDAPGPSRAGGLVTGSSTSTTSAPAPIQAVGAGTAVIASPGGAEITFIPDPQHPGPRLTGTAAEAAITRLTAGGVVWEATGRTLTVRAPNARQADTVPLGGFSAGSLAWAGGRLWVLDAAATRLLAVDPATRRASAPADIVHPLQPTPPAAIGGPTGTTAQPR